MQKRYCIIAFLFFFVSNIVAQSNNVAEDIKIYSIVQKKAEPTEGMSMFLQNFTNHFNTLIVPPKFDELSFKISFVIEKDGSLSNFEILDNVHAYAYAEEIIKVLGTFPKWKPAEKENRIVRSLHTVSVKLRFPMRSVDKDLLEKAILGRIIKNEYFEFECNCKLIAESINDKNNIKSFSYNTPNGDVFYSISLKEMSNDNALHYFNIIKNEAKKENKIINEVDYKKNKAIESSFMINNNESYFFNNTINFIEENYFITITVISKNEQISKFNFRDLKQTFKLKNQIKP